MKCENLGKEYLDWLDVQAAQKKPFLDFNEWKFTYYDGVRR